MFIDIYNQVSICKTDPNIYNNIRISINLSGTFLGEGLERNVLRGCIKFGKHREIVGAVLPDWTSFSAIRRRRTGYIVQTDRYRPGHGRRRRHAGHV